MSPPISLTLLVSLFVFTHKRHPLPSFPKPPPFSVLSSAPPLPPLSPGSQALLFTAWKIPSGMGTLYLVGPRFRHLYHPATRSNCPACSPLNLPAPLPQQRRPPCFPRKPLFFSPLLGMPRFCQPGPPSMVISPSSQSPPHVAPNGCLPITPKTPKESPCFLCFVDP